MNALLWFLLHPAVADPTLPDLVLLGLPNSPDRSAFLVLVSEDALPRILAPADQLTTQKTQRLTWALTEASAFKLRAGTPESSAPGCAPGGTELGSRSVPQRLSKSALELAPAEPQPLEHVWLVSRSKDGTLVHPATVDRVDEGVLHYVLLQPVSLVASTGGPVVDVLGRVVGVHNGIQETEDGRTLGRACSLVATRAALESRVPP